MFKVVTHQVDSELQDVSVLGPQGGGHGLESLENDLRNDLVQLCTPFRQIVDLRKMTKHSFIFVHININQNSKICN